MTDVDKEEEEESVEELTPEELKQKKIDEERQALEEAQKPLYEQIEKICRDLAEAHPFNILLSEYMDVLNHDR